MHGALQRERRRVGVVARERRVDEEVLVAGVDEQCGLVGPDHRDQLAGGVDVALVGEELIVGLAVDLNGHPVGQGPKAYSPVIGKHAS